MATGYTKVAAQSSSYSSSTFCLVIESNYSNATGGKATITSTAYMYCTWSSVPFYSWPSSFNIKIDGSNVASSTSEPNSSGDWSSVSTSFGGTTYKLRCKLGSASKEITYDYETTPSISTSTYYKISGSADYLPSSSGATASVSVTLPSQAKPTCTITYDANGGSTTPTAQTKTNGTAITLAAAISRNNSTANGYVVTYNANGGNTPSATSQTQKNTTSYTFAGWKSSINSTVYSGGASYNVDGDTTMTAQWNSSTTKGTLTSPTCTRGNGTATRTVTFNANGGSCSTSSLNSTATITYSMNGWYTATSGGTKRVNANTSYTPSATETLYAQWGSSTGSYSAITLPTATRTGYIFKGWSTSSTATSGSTGSYTPTGSVTLYAVWQEDTRGNIYLKQNGAWVLVSSQYQWADR